MNWQEVIDALRFEQRNCSTKGLSAVEAAVEVGNAKLLKALADALQMGLNKAGKP